MRNELGGNTPSLLHDVYEVILRDGVPNSYGKLFMVVILEARVFEAIVLCRNDWRKSGV